MTIKNSSLYKDVVKTSRINLGQLYFFNSIMVAEFKEGAHVTFENAQELIREIRVHFGKKPFGFISNMVNSYSINPTDTLRFKEELKNLTTYTVVSYTKAGKLNAEIENNFCKNENFCFDNLYDATIKVKQKLKNLIPINEIQV